MNLLTWRRRGAWRGGWLGALTVTVALGGGAWEALAAPEQDFGARVKRWEHLVERGEPEAARAELDTVDLDALTGPAERLVVASLYALAGDRAKAAAIAGAVTEPEMASQVMAVTRPEATVAELLGDARGADACARTDVAVTLGRVGRPGEVVPYLRAVLSRAPDCAAAAQRLAVALIDAGDGAGAAAIAAAALEHDPKNAALQLARISALQMNGDLSGAIDALESLVRSPERQQGHMGLLLAMYLRERRVEARLDYWMKASEAAPAEVVPRFMVGVLLHYGNHFAASDTWLVPLFEEMPGEPRLFVYHAMNLFNLGQPAKARELLETAAAGSSRRSAGMWRRGMEMSTRSMAVAASQAAARAAVARAALEQCAADGTAVCDGPWEHPRLRGWEAPWVRPALAGLLAAVVAAIGVVLWRRRRATGAR